ncbi:MAG: site-specific integrase, partial [Candidatus Obscuribacterales bacterium]|nr:site-specific integrase [Candidatus Obscuribacterales bacterium]
MIKSNLIGSWIRRFLLEHLVVDRNLSLNTQASYRDTLVLLLPFAAKHSKVSIDKLSIENLSPELVRQFLLHLEVERKCSIVTRNQRLAAIHALARYIGSKSPEELSWCSGICALPFKKAPKSFMCYLEKAEMDALLEAPDRSSIQGARDYALILFLYNTGARVDEAA